MRPAVLYRRIYSFGDALTLAVYADSREALNLAGLVPGVEDAPHPPAMELFFLGGRAAFRGATGGPGDGEEILRTPSVSVYSRGMLHFGYWHGKAESVLDRGRNRAVIVMPGARMYHPDFVSRSVCRPVLDRMLWEAGYIPLHAAAVAYPEGMIIIGDAGTGKTTLLRGLLAEGAEFRADDRAVLRESGSLLRYPEAIRFVGSAHRRKRVLLPPAGNSSPVPLRRILFLEPSPGKTRIEPAGRAESAARMIQALSPYLAEGEWDAACGHIERVLRGAEGYVLRGWDVPAERVRVVRRYFGKASV